ncbi:MAG: hypothetical protein PHC61_12275 [Chitinivibrionales bacterium]|nr:hypothetical protein [Chitinivibrionales bacterium]
MYNPNDPQSVEKYSSAITLSDMELFIFPELLFAVTLANMMSPALWQWPMQPWFDKLDAMSPYRRVLRLKQYIMDNFTFNLDLDTWGLTTKPRELARFSAYIDPAVLARSNALFGYEGDKYYFDIDIRRHFGLDKYTSDVIPYWKTETIEAMQAFRFKEGYVTGAGECVSLSTLYAAALALVAKIPFESIFMMATPLHSQTFIAINEGLITNNRRIVTKKMWFNGTEISEKARRALEHENVTIVANHTGYIHLMYPEATIERGSYETFTRNLHEYLKTDITYEILAAFLRQKSGLQHCFQLAHKCCGKPRYIEAEKIYSYEHGSKSRIGDETQKILLHEIDEDEYYTEPIPGRIMLDEFEVLLKQNPVYIDHSGHIDQLKKNLQHTCFNVQEVVEDLIAFCKSEPRLPDIAKTWKAAEPLLVSEHLDSRQALIDYCLSMRDKNETADLAFSAGRDMAVAPWKPFLKAALERNPVSIAACGNFRVEAVYNQLAAMNPLSIYEGTRLAQPDEVWNYKRGDGLEKALCFMNILKASRPQDTVVLKGDGKNIIINCNGKSEYRFESAKNLPMPLEGDFAF